MKKILVYGETEREARAFYQPRADERVGERTYKDFGNGEPADDIIVIDPNKVELPKISFTPKKKK